MPLHEALFNEERASGASGIGVTVPALPNTEEGTVTPSGDGDRAQGPPIQLAGREPRVGLTRLHLVSPVLNQFTLPRKPTMSEWSYILQRASWDKVYADAISLTT